MSIIQDVSALAQTATKMAGYTGKNFICFFNRLTTNRVYVKFLEFVFFILSLTIQDAIAQLPSDFDDSFNGGLTYIDLGYVNHVRDVIKQSDGKIVYTGYWQESQNGNGAVRQIVLGRFNADGSVDTSFGSGGLVYTAIGQAGVIDTILNVNLGTEGYKVLQQTDGKLVVAGLYTRGSLAGSKSIAIVRYTSNGSLDSSFGGDGIVVKATTAIGTTNTYAETIIQQSDGKLVVGGYTASSSAFLIRFNPDGTEDAAFNSVNGSVQSLNNSLVEQPDGKVVSASYNGSNIIITRYSQNAAVDPGFSSAIGPNVNPSLVALQGDGKILAVGLTNSNFTAVRRYNNNGSFDATFGTAGSYISGQLTGNYNSLLKQANGNIVVGGYIGGTFSIMRLSPSGVLDSSFGNAGVVGSYATGTFSKLVRENDGKWFAASYGGTGIYLMRFLGEDTDDDGIAENIDNCSADFNPDQANADGDAQGNACDPDDDNDSLSDAQEATLGTNPLLADSDSDTVGDASDNCPLTANTNQLNTDGDAQGDACDSDDDNDGHADNADAFPLNPAEWADTDSDTIGDNADNCPTISNADQLNTDGDAQGNACDTDDDNDAIPDGSDVFPLDAAESLDSDGDGIGNNVDQDDDNDGVPDANDRFPLNAGETIDTDGDGIGNNTDTDDDNDGVPDVSDPFPLVATETLDSDSDGLGNNADNCPSIANANQKDSDGDGQGDVCDSTPYGDSDGDGVDNLSDNCPSVANANQQDTDSDGKGNACDPDNGGTGGVQVIGGQVFANGGDVIVKVMPASAGYTSELHLSSPGADRFIALNRNVGMVVNLGSFPAGTELVFSIYVRNTGKTFFTGAADRNPDGLVHVAVETEGSGMATVGFEDTFGGGDHDYNDNMFRFIGVNETSDLDNDGIGNSTDTDDDGDGWTDAAEATCGSNSLSAGSVPVDTDGDGNCNAMDTDDDNDGASDTVEIQLGTDPLVVTNFAASTKDSDGDGITDTKEIAIGTSPNLADSDGDGLSDDTEIMLYCSNAKSNDSDSDGIPDNIDPEPNSQNICTMPLGGMYKGSIIKEGVGLHP